MRKLMGSGQLASVLRGLTCEYHEWIAPDRETRVDETGLNISHPWRNGRDERLVVSRVK